MAKSKEELKQLKKEYEALTSKLKGLSEDELKVVTGGKLDCLATNNNPENTKCSSSDESIITIKEQQFR